MRKSYYIRDGLANPGRMRYTDHMRSNQTLRSFLHAAGVFIYVLAVAWVMSHGEAIFGGGPDGFIVPVFMILLFVVSASITGFLVLGKPVQLYLDGSKKQAVAMLFATLGWLVLFLLLVLLSVLPR